MIHINRGNGIHEWLTSEEFAKRYPNAELNAPRPYADRNRRLKETRIACDLSLREMAKRIGVSASYLSAMETGKIPADNNVVEFYERLKEVSNG